MHEPPAAAENAIEIRIDDISQLFHTLDPFPFRERDLDKDAEEFVSWARELPADQPFPDRRAFAGGTSVNSRSS